MFLFVRIIQFCYSGVPSLVVLFRSIILLEPILPRAASQLQAIPGRLWRKVEKLKKYNIIIRYFTLTTPSISSSLERNV